MSNGQDNFVPIAQRVCMVFAIPMLLVIVSSVHASAPHNGRIAFTSDRDGNREIYVMRSDGTDQVRLTSNNTIDDHPTWSPSGQSIAFLGERAAGGFAIFVMKPDGTGRREITLVNYQHTGTWHGWDGWSMSWSPDGRQIVFSEGSSEVGSLVVVNSDGTKRRNLAAGFCPAWSPDGSKILFLRVGVPNPFIHYLILTIRPDGTDLRNITPTLQNLFAVWTSPPVWSPDGLKIAFVSFDSANMEINIANANGLDPELFTTGCTELVPEGCSLTSLPAWSPNGRTIAFLNWGQSSGTEIYAKNIGEGEVIRLTDTLGINSNPNWQPLSIRDY